MKQADVIESNMWSRGLIKDNMGIEWSGSGELGWSIINSWKINYK